MWTVPVLPETAASDVVLVRRRVLGGPGEHEVPGQISIGRADPVRLRAGADGIDGELAALLAREADEHHYYLLSLSCTFRDGEAPIESATLSVALRQADRPGVPRPVVWSMDPLRVSTPVAVRRSVRFGPKVTFAPVGADAAATRDQQFTTDVPHIVAQGEGEDQVEWVFRRTAAVSLLGVYHLRLVVRTSAWLPCRADLALAATRREQRWGLVPYRATLPPAVGTVGLRERAD